MRILLLCVVLMASACAGSKKRSTVVYEPAAADMITLQRTGCFGTCPIYEVTIFGNGIVSYNGKGFTDFEGKYVGQVAAQTATTLFRKLNLLEWNSYPDEYPIDNVDFPQFFLKYKTSNTDKIIKGNSRAAEELIAISKEIDDLVSEISLKKQLE